MLDRIPLVDLAAQHQPLAAELLAAFNHIFDRGDFILGQAVQTFEQDFARYCQRDWGRGVASGTAAIALGLKACGLQPGDEVLVPANAFIATLLGVEQAGGKPVLVDCDRATALMDLDQAAAALTPRTRAIVPVHLYGQMVPPEPLQALAQDHGLILFEDVTQAHGASRDGYRAGSLGQAAAFSFYPSKNLGAMGNGGMVVTNNRTIADRVATLRNYGAPDKYFYLDPGTDSRLDSLQAALLQVKLPHLDRWNQERYSLAQTYDRLLAPLADRGIYPLTNSSGSGHVYHLYVVVVEGNETSRINRDWVQACLAQEQIQTGIHYPIPCHLQPAFAHLGYQKGDFPNTEALSECILSLPLYPGLSPAMVEWIVTSLIQV